MIAEDIVKQVFADAGFSEAAIAEYLNREYASNPSLPKWYCRNVNEKEADAIREELKSAIKLSRDEIKKEIAQAEARLLKRSTAN